MSKNIDRLLKAAKEARDNAYAPYSNFLVGAAVLSSSGKIFAGCNVENLSYGLTICAERNAIFRMVSEGDREIEKIFIIGKTEEILPPCGACRQVIAEFSGENTAVYMSNKKGEWKKTSLIELLPYTLSSLKAGKND